MTGRRVVVVLLIAVSVFAAAVGSLHCSNSYPAKMEPVTIAIVPVESSSLLYIADDQHFFARNGLDMNMRNYDVGLTAVNGMLSGEADFAVAAEYIMVGSAFRKEDISIIASIDRGQFMYLIGRRDRGVETISDLRGKKIGVARQTIMEFYLGRYLDLHGMSLTDVTLIDVKAPAQWTGSISSGDIDAVVVFQPYANSIKAQLGDNAVLWPVQSSQPLYSIMVCRDDWIKKNPSQVNGFLNAVAQAEEYMIYHPAEASAILQKRLKFDDAYMATVWSQNQFSLSLDQSLIAAMEDEARWMISNKVTREKTVPDFNGHIYLDGLKDVRPGAVTIIR